MTTDPARITRPGPVSRLKLTEPVRLYLWPVVLGLLVAFVALGWTTQEWTDWALALLAPALGVGAAGEAARASVYAPRTHVADVIRAAGPAGWSNAAAVLDAGSDVQLPRPVFRVPS